MFTRLPLVSLLALVVLSLAAGSAGAQRRNDRYQYRKPTISPYLNLLQPSQGGLPSYYAFVRPLQEQQKLIQRQAQPLVRPGQAAAPAVGPRIQIGVAPEQQMLAPRTGVASQFKTEAAKFQNYSHFFPAARSGGRRR